MIKLFKNLFNKFRLLGYFDLTSIGLVFLRKRFLRGNVMVTGEKGSGKDVMFGNLISRFNMPYISNCDFTNGKNFIPLDFSMLEVGRNDYRNFITGKVNKYIYPYNDGVFIWISDAGNYLPSHYCSQLDRSYPYLPTLFSLIRQLGDSQIHTNTQAFERVWNKLREQGSDCFIRCNRCFVLFGFLVIGSYTFYDKAESCQNRVKPCRVRMPLFANRDQRLQVNMYKDKFYNQYGTVQNRMYICINRSKHNSRFFKEVLENGI